MLRLCYIVRMKYEKGTRNMTNKAGNVEGEQEPRKPKSIRGIVRKRHWKTGGQKRTAWQADFGFVNGKRLMRSYETKEDAENWLREQTLQVQDQGAAAFRISDAERLDAIRARDELAHIDDLPTAALLETVAKVYRSCRDVLKGCNGTIDDAVAYYRKHKTPDGEKRTVNQLIEEYIADAIAHNLRPASIRDIRQNLKSFAQRFGHKLVTEITRKNAQAWVDSLTVSPSSKRHCAIIAHGAFNYGIRQEYTTENPFSKNGGRKDHEDERMPECLTVKQVQKIMQAAVKHEASMVAPLAIGFFSGLRTAELRGLDWKDIDLAQNRITVIPETAKKRRARHVEIEANLFSWLLPHRKESGLVAPDGEKWRSRLDNVRVKAGVKWLRNSMRHSFASHHLSKYGDPVKTAFQLGHQHDTGMLFEHYRALTTPEDGAKYFEIKPETKAKGNVIPGDFARTA
jgi:integrase